MSDETTYHFEWDPTKAHTNVAKHGVTFQRATLVFRDPLALSLYDAEHSDTEDRWATLGLTADSLRTPSTWLSFIPGPSSGAMRSWCALSRHSQLPRPRLNNTNRCRAISG